MNVLRLKNGDFLNLDAVARFEDRPYGIDLVYPNLDTDRDQIVFRVDTPSDVDDLRRRLDSLAAADRRPDSKDCCGVRVSSHR